MCEVFRTGPITQQRQRQGKHRARVPGVEEGEGLGVALGDPAQQAGVGRLCVIHSDAPASRRAACHTAHAGRWQGDSASRTLDGRHPSRSPPHGLCHCTRRENCRSPRGWGRR